MKRFGLIDARVILAPRGMLKTSALHFKPAKKKVFLFLLRRLQITRFVQFHATDAAEVSEIKACFGPSSRVTHISNYPGSQSPFRPPPPKQSGELRMVFVGRIHPVKNLLFLLKCLVTIKDRVYLTVIAAIEDEPYWVQCQDCIRRFPPHITVTFSHDVPHHNIEEMIQAHHLFVLPTRGENFGHAIFEALAAGRPALISDQTPWRDLEMNKAGWDLSLDIPEKFTDTIRKAAQMTYEDWLDRCKHTWQYCQKKCTILT